MKPTVKKIDDKADVMRQESGGVTLSSIAEWKNSVVEVMTAYLAQIEEEEKEVSKHFVAQLPACS